MEMKDCPAFLKWQTKYGCVTPEKRLTHPTQGQKPSKSTMMISPMIGLETKRIRERIYEIEIVDCRMR